MGAVAAFRSGAAWPGHGMFLGRAVTEACRGRGLGPPRSVATAVSVRMRVAAVRTGRFPGALPGAVARPGLAGAGFAAHRRVLTARPASRLHHDGNPALEWCVGNVVGRSDRRGNLYPAKQRPEQKIDAAVALMMAVERAMAEDASEGDPMDFLRNPIFG